MKFTECEAEGTRPFVENSPPFAWTYSVFGVRGMSCILGFVEIGIALMIASSRWFPKVASLGSLLAVGMFLSTISFLITTPRAWLPETGFLAIGVPGQFLLKDFVLLAAALNTAANSLSSINSKLVCSSSFFPFAEN